MVVIRRVHAAFEQTAWVTRDDQDKASRNLGVLFGCFGRNIDGDSFYLVV